MNLHYWLPSGGIAGLTANISEALRYRREPDLYERTELTPQSIASIHRQMNHLSAGSFAQGRMDNCYLVSAIKALANTPLGQRQLRTMMRIEKDHIAVRFWDTIGYTWVPVRSIFTHGIQTTRTHPRASFASAIESAYAEFRLVAKGRLPTMGFTGETLEEITGVQTLQKRRLTGFRDHDLQLISNALSAKMPATVSTVGANPTLFTDVYDITKGQFNAVAEAVVPGIGPRLLQVRAAHAYLITAVNDNVTLVNPWEYNRLDDGDVIRAKSVPHPGTFQLSLDIFKRLFGHFALIPPKSAPLWARRLDQTRTLA